MRRSALLGAILISSAIAAEPAPGAPPASGLAPGARNRVTGELCEPARSVPAARGEAPSAKKLGKLPPGNVVLTVVREMDGCAAPVVVRQGFSGSGAPSERGKQGLGATKLRRR